MNMLSLQEPVTEISGVLDFILWLTMAVRNIHSGKVAKVDEIQLEMLKLLDKVGAVWLTSLCVPL